MPLFVGGGPETAVSEQTSKSPQPTYAQHDHYPKPKSDTTIVSITVQCRIGNNSGDDSL